MGDEAGQELGPRLAELEAELEAERRQRLRAEGTLRELEERHRLLVEGVRDYALILLDPAGRITGWNEGATRLLGYRQEEVLGLDSALTFTEEDRRAGKPRRELEQAQAAGS